MARAGAVWLSVLPDMSMFGRSIAAESAVQLGPAGSRAGMAFGKGLKSTAVLSAKETTAAVKAQLESTAVAAGVAADKAAGRVALASKRERDAIGQVRLAELRLAETRKGDKASATQLAVAEERLAKAERGQAIAAGQSKVAAAELATAQKGAATATEAAAARTDVASAGMGRFGAAGAGAFGRVGASALAFGATVGKVGLGLGGLGFAIFAAKGVKAAGDFQKSMTLLVTAGGESKKAIGLVSQGILGLAVSTGTSTTHLAEGMYLMEKAGFRGAKGLLVLKAAAQGAKDENVDLATMTNAVTSVMRSYNLPATAAVRVTNMMVAASGAAKTTMQEFAGSLSTVMPIASSAGLSFAQVGGAIATLTSHGTSANEATQELANTIRNLKAPNRVAVNEMAQFGISSNDVSIKLGKRGLSGTMEYLTQTILKRMGPAGTVMLKTFNASKVAASAAQQMFSALPAGARKLATAYEAGKISLGDYRKQLKLLPADQAALAQQWVVTENKAKGFNSELRAGGQPAQTYQAALKAMLGGATGLNTALQLTGGSSATFSRNIATIGAAGKKSGKDIATWADMQGTFNVQLDKFKEAIAVAGIKLGTVLMPPLTKVIQFILGSAVPGVRHLWETLAPIGKQLIGALVPGFRSLGNFLAGSVVPAVKSLAITFGGLAKTVATMSIAAVIAAWRGFGKLLTGSVGPALMSIVRFVARNKTVFNSMAVGVLALYGGIKALAIAQLAWDAVTAITSASLLGLAMSIRGVWIAITSNPVGAIIVGLFALGAALVYAYKHSETFRRIVNRAFGDVKTIALDVVHFFTGPFASGFATAWGVVSGVFMTVYRAVAGAVSATIGFVRRHWALLVTIIGGPLGAIIVQVIKHWTGVKRIFTTGFGVLRSIVKVAWAIIAGIFKVGLKVLETIMKVAIAVIAGPFIVLWTFVLRRPVKAFWGWITGFIRGSFKATTGVMSAVGGGFAAAWSTLWSGVSAVFRVAWGGIQGTWKRVSGWFAAAWRAFTSLSSSTWRGIVRAAQAIWSVIGGPIMKVWNTLAGWFGWAWGKFKLVNKLMWQAVVHDAHAVWGKIGGPIKAVWTGLSNWFHQAWGSFEKFVSKTWKRIASIIPNAMAGLATALSTIWNDVKVAVEIGINKVLGLVNNLIGGLNWILSKLGIKGIGKIPLISIGGGGGGPVAPRQPGTGPKKAFAAGGIMPGYTPGRDVHTIAVSGGEAVMRPEWTRAAGPAYVHGANKAARSGGVTGAQQFIGEHGLPGFFLGGIVGKVLGGIKDFGLYLARKGADALINHILPPIESAAGHIPPPIVGQMAEGAIKSVAGGIRGWFNRETKSVTAKGAGGGKGGGGPVLAGGSLGTIVRQTIQQLGRPRSEEAGWMRRIMFESGGSPTAVNRSDSNWPAHPSVGLAQVIRGTFQANAGQYRNVGPFAYGVSENGMANSYAGAHYAVGRYGSLAAVDPAGPRGPIGYDRGGVLRPGPSLVMNGHRQPETVLPPRESAALRKIAASTAGDTTGGASADDIGRAVATYMDRATFKLDFGRGVARVVAEDQKRDRARR